MATPPILNLRNEDFPEVPWIDRLLRPLKTFGRDVQSALTSGLTLSGNTVAQKISFTVTLFANTNTVELHQGWTYVLEEVEEHYQPPVWRKLDDGMVWVNGTISGGPARGKAFVLPEPAWPKRMVHGWAYGSFDGMPQAYGVEVDRFGAVYAAPGYDGTCDFLHMNFTFEAADLTPIQNPAFPLSFLLQLPPSTRPVGVVPLRVVEVVSGQGERGVGRAVGVDWTTSGDQLVVTDLPGLLAGKTYKVTLLVIGE